MDIDDILEKEFGVDFEEVDKYLTEEMNLYAGKFLVKRMEEVFGNKDRAKKWYFSEIPSLGYKRPYDLSKEGEHIKLGRMLTSIEHNLYS